MSRGHDFKHKDYFSNASDVGVADVGYFWHVTDMHWDPTYGDHGVSCGSTAPPSEQRGHYGDYACDSPWTLINSSVYAMKRIKSDVDFLIWTGYAYGDPVNNLQLLQWTRVKWLALCCRSLNSRANLMGYVFNKFFLFSV
jgi:hypothetical protein